MSAADVIADHFPDNRWGESGHCGHYYNDAGDPVEFDTFQEWGAHVLDALKAAGYAVVELPKPTIIPTGWGDDCIDAWPAGGKVPYVDPVSAWPNGEVALPNGDFIPADKARCLALALLAAADAAEATK